MPDRLYALSCLRLHPRKTMILPCEVPTALCGVVVAAGAEAAGSDRDTPPQPAAQVADRWQAGTIGAAEADARIQPWRGHASQAGSRARR